MARAGARTEDRAAANAQARQLSGVVAEVEAAKAETALRSPVAGEVSVTVSHRIAANTLERAESGPARDRFESMSTSPYLSAVRLSQRTGSNAVDGNGNNAALSSSNTSATPLSGPW